jgi:hypothetical protein
MMKFNKRNIAIAALVAVALCAAVAVSMQRGRPSQERSALSDEEAQAIAKLAVQRREAEAEQKRRADAEAAQKAQEVALEALQAEQREAAVAEVKAAFTAGDYPGVIIKAEQFDTKYGMDAQIALLEQQATDNLREGARRGNFAQILDYPDTKSYRFRKLREWATAVREHAKPVEYGGRH